MFKSTLKKEIFVFKSNCRPVASYDNFSRFSNCRYIEKNILKFMYFEKATKFCEIFTFLLSFVVLVKSKVNISQNFEAFSEYLNFTICMFALCQDCFFICIDYHVEVPDDWIEDLINRSLEGAKHALNRIIWYIWDRKRVLYN